MPKVWHALGGGAAHPVQWRSTPWICWVEMDLATLTLTVPMPPASETRRSTRHPKSRIHDIPLWSYRWLSLPAAGVARAPGDKCTSTRQDTSMSPDHFRLAPAVECRINPHFAAFTTVPAHAGVSPCSLVESALVVSMPCRCFELRSAAAPGRERIKTGTSNQACKPCRGTTVGVLRHPSHRGLVQDTRFGRT